MTAPLTAYHLRIPAVLGIRYARGDDLLADDIASACAVRLAVAWQGYVANGDDGRDGGKRLGCYLMLCCDREALKVVKAARAAKRGRGVTVRPGGVAAWRGHGVDAEDHRECGFRRVDLLDEVQAVLRLLSPAEVDVLRLLADGLGYREAGRQLGRDRNYISDVVRAVRARVAAAGMCGE